MFLKDNANFQKFVVLLCHIKAATLFSKTHKPGDTQEREELVILARSCWFIFPGRQGTPLCGIIPIPRVHSSGKWEQSQEIRYLSLFLENGHQSCPFSVGTARSALRLYPLGLWPRKQNSNGLHPMGRLVFWPQVGFNRWETLRRDRKIKQFRPLSPPLPPCQATCWQGLPSSMKPTCSVSQLSQRSLGFGNCFLLAPSGGNRFSLWLTQGCFPNLVGLIQPQVCK